MKKKTWLWVIIPALVLAIAIGASPAFAHGNSPLTEGDTWENGGHCFGGGFMDGGMMGGYMGFADPVTLERVAGVLGLTYEELTARLTEGETIAKIAQEQGVSLSLVIDTILAPQSEILQVRVKYGYLTDEVADSILEQARLRLEQALTSTFAANRGYAGQQGTYGPGYGMGGGMMGGGQNGGWNGGGMMGGGMMGGGWNGGGMMGGGMMGGW